MNSNQEPNQWKMSIDELVHGAEGQLVSRGETTFTGVGTDTRMDLSGKIFVALKGDSFDAHDFLVKAVKAGAAALLVHRIPDEARADLFGTTIVEVKDTLAGLQKLGGFWRHKMRAKIIGITGTNGKTTTKEFAAALIGSKFNVQYSKGSFNNHWGVPISLLSIEPSHQIALIEMGMNHPGELKVLCEIAEPDAVGVTMVGRGHLEGVGTIEGVAKAKAEIYEFSPKQAVRIFNLENEHTLKMFEEWKNRLPPSQIVTFSGSGAASGSADISFHVEWAKADELKIRGEIRGVTGEAIVGIFGAHNVTNLMAAAACALVTGMSPAEIWQALPLCKMAWGRNQWVKLENGARVLFDAYNANPESMGAAVENFKNLAAPAGGKKIAILAEMRELGSHAGEMHRELGARVASAGFDTVCFVGPSKGDFMAGLTSGGFKKSPLVSDSYELNLATRMLPVLHDNDLILMKGSRGMELERFLMELKPLDFHSKKS
jgi:UDP-N-acetylmuramoyl-tripeptide--D-alanyl-D-alanine ligase